MAEREEFRERNETIRTLKSQGVGARSLAQMYGISRDRVYQICDDGYYQRMARKYQRRNGTTHDQAGRPSLDTEIHAHTTRIDLARDHQGMTDFESLVMASWHSGRDTQEIADKIGVTEAAVYNALGRAREKQMRRAV